MEQPKRESEMGRQLSTSILYFDRCHQRYLSKDVTARRLGQFVELMQARRQAVLLRSKQDATHDGSRIKQDECVQLVS